MADEKDKRFTFDPESEGAEVPTLTSLLYKKKRVKSDSSNPSSDSALPTTLEPTKSISIHTATQEPALVVSDFAGNPASVSSPSPEPTQVVLPVVPAQSASDDAPALALVDSIPLELAGSPATAIDPEAPKISSSGSPQILAPEALEGSADAALKGLAVLQKRQLVRSALIFRPEDGGKRYAFCEQLGRPESQALWTGIALEVSDFTDLMGRLGKFGFIEFSPVGLAGAGNVDRQGFRVAFGIEGSEWLTLVRVGSSQSPESLVAVVSDSSVQAHLPFFHSAGKAKAA